MNHSGRQIKSSLSILLGVALMFSLFGCGVASQRSDGDGMVYEPTYTQISQDEAKLMMQDDDGHVIVDVRRADEYAEGHIPGAILISNEEIGTKEPEKLPDKNQTILVYCRSGRRSKEASQKLADMGYVMYMSLVGLLTGLAISSRMIRAAEAKPHHSASSPLMAADRSLML